MGRSSGRLREIGASVEVSWGATHGVATPEGWQPGDKVIVPPPVTVEGADARMKEGYECTDWFFCKKTL